MSTPTPNPAPASAPPALPHGMRRFLDRGESLIAWVGLAAAGVLLLTMAASAWWAVREKRTVAENSRHAHIRALADHLEESALTMLASNDVSALRRAVAGVKRNEQVKSARVTLTDGRIIADAEPGRITAGEVPDRFPSGPLDSPESATEASGALIVRRPLIVPGRGPAVLELAAPAAMASSSWNLGAGLALMCSFGLAALWLVYRHMRMKVRTLALIRDGLLAMRSGERAREVLEIAGETGPEVAAWNELLKEAETLRKGTLLSQLSQQQERRKESKSELELACDSLSVGMIVLDGQGRAKHANGAAASLLGFAREKLVGTDVAAVIDHAEIRSAIVGIVTGASMQRRTAEVTRAHPAPENNPEGASGNGNPPASVLRVQVRPLRREDSCAALVTLEDITQLRVAEASRHAFVAQATHELRTPLTNMRLCLEMAIEEGAKDPAVLGKSLNTLNQETRRLERMVSEMLSVAEIEAGSLELHAGDVRLDAVFESLRSDFEAPALERQIDLSFDLPPKIPVIHGDRDKLVLAIHNLIGNAIKYTPPGGKVVVVLKADAKDVTVEVTDTGIGISEQDQPLVFGKFYRAKDPRVEKETGSGLGLALAMEVARLHGGGITLRSQLDKGSTFTLTVPVFAQSTRRAA